MNRNFIIFSLAVLIVAALLLGTVAYKVDFTQYALVKTFGRTSKVVDGRRDAGLHFKWPYPVQKLVRYDARTFVFEDTANEVPTGDKQNLLLTVYCGWRIDDPGKFHSSIITVKAAQERLRDLLRSAKKDVLAMHRMEELVNTDPQRMRIPQIEQELLEPVRAQAAQDYGVQIVTIGIKSLGLPQTVSHTVIEAMKEERQKDVRRYEAAGEAQAMAIRERAKAASERIMAFAQRKADNIRSEGARAASEYYKEFAGYEQFSMFLRNLESLKKELASKTVILLDATQVPAIRLFHSTPSQGGMPSLPAPAKAPQDGDNAGR